MAWYFIFFFVSGFCSILYELVWLRLTMAQFGVTTALISITLSMFMLGMGAGSSGAGILMRRLEGKLRFSPLRLYGLAEFLIGCSSLAVPAQLHWGHRLLESVTRNSALSSGTYYLASGAFVALILVPWCFFMGATYPLAMSAIRYDRPRESPRSFSFLYLSNVVGAVAGSVVPLFLIEIRGFHGTLLIGSLLNVAIAAAAFALTLKKREVRDVPAPEVKTAAKPVPIAGNGLLALLFLTGLATMGMEVIWIRLYTPYLGPLVYSFASILASYLLATFAGSVLYRRASKDHDANSRLKWVSLTLLGLLPLLTADPRIPRIAALPQTVNGLIKVMLGVCPFAMMIGFLTPMLVDRWSKGDPDRAGEAYTVNIAGCIVGPLLTGFILLPLFGEPVSMLLYVLPWIVMAFMPQAGGEERSRSRVPAYALVAAGFAVFFLTKNYETIFPHREVLRDSTATVIATGEGLHKKLLTNGVGMTELTPITKMMAHITLSSLDRKPENILVICFGMGTTYRSLAAWDVQETAVELVPSVPRLFTYYHSDGDQILASPRSHLVVDDGRRFLERTPEKFDAIIIDPPPPIEAAASSLLYSEEFYAVAKRRMQKDGILAQWLPGADNAVRASVAKAIQESFPYVRVFRSLDGWGWHFQASMSPIPIRSSAELLARMPPAAVTDMMEWGPDKTPLDQIQHMISTETTTEPLIAASPQSPAMHDDRPINEYYLLRRILHKHRSSEAIAVGN